MNTTLVIPATLAAFCSTACGQCDWLPALNGPDGGIRSFMRWDPDGAGPEPELLYMAGYFQNTAGQNSRRIAAWDGSTWRFFDESVNNVVRAMAVYQENLIIAGDFTSASGSTANRIARWDGNDWQPLGSGMNEDVMALAVHDGKLIAGGFFTTAGGQPARHVAAWDGNTWQAMDSPGRAGDIVEAITVWNGSLIIGGSFSTSTGSVLPSIWMRDAGAWTAMGPTDGGNIKDLLVMPDNTFYASGEALNDFTIADPATILARWDGTHWDRDDFVDISGTGYSMTVFNGKLTVAGQFWFMPNGNPTGNVATWDSGGWGFFGSGANGEVFAVEAYQDLLYIGGFFDTAGGLTSEYLARWGCPLPACYANCDGSTQSPVLNVSDFGCFLTKFASGDPYANCDGSTSAPQLNVADFGCFLTKFAAGCT